MTGLARRARHVLERLTRRERHFQRLAGGQPLELQLGPHPRHRAAQRADVKRCGPRSGTVADGMSRPSYLILHGYQGSGPGHWQSWLAGRLRAADAMVAYPDLPDADAPPLEHVAGRAGARAATRSASRRSCSATRSPACCGCTTRRRVAGRRARVLLVAPPSLSGRARGAARVLPGAAGRRALGRRRGSCAPTTTRTAPRARPTSTRGLPTDLLPGAGPHQPGRGLRAVARGRGLGPRRPAPITARAPRRAPGSRPGSGRSGRAWVPSKSSTVCVDAELVQLGREGLGAEVEVVLVARGRRRGRCASSSAARRRGGRHPHRVPRPATAPTRRRRRRPSASNGSSARPGLAGIGRVARRRSRRSRAGAIHSHFGGSSRGALEERRPRSRRTRRAAAAPSSGTRAGSRPRTARRRRARRARRRRPGAASARPSRRSRRTTCRSARGGRGRRRVG